MDEPHVRVTAGLTWIRDFRVFVIIVPPQVSSPWLDFLAIYICIFVTIKTVFKVSGRP